MDTRVIRDFHRYGRDHHIDLSREDTIKAARRIRKPERVKSWYLTIEGRDIPIKQLYGEATGLDRRYFTTIEARIDLMQLGFEPQSKGGA